MICWHSSSFEHELCLYTLQSDAADALSRFYYPPVAAVTVSYPKEAIRKECLIDGELQGFGQLHPRSQGVETLGISCKRPVLKLQTYTDSFLSFPSCFISSINFILFSD
jgi:hypothetical protein